MSRALILLRNKNLIAPAEIHQLFFQLLRCQVGVGHELINRIGEEKIVCPPPPTPPPPFQRYHCQLGACGWPCCWYRAFIILDPVLRIQVLDQAPFFTLDFYPRSGILVIFCRSRISDPGSSSELSNNIRG
jgi:hypothetical protein